MKIITIVLVLAQGACACRVAMRWARTARGRRIARYEGTIAPGQVTVLVPVLNEERRLAPCLAGLIAQGPEVAEIVVIDGGSTDATQEIVRSFSHRDPRVRLVDASPVPPLVNGKAYGLCAGVRNSPPETPWVLMMDADVRPDPALAPSLLAHAAAEGVDALSVATLQEVSGSAEALLHPAMLATLVYRLGIPGYATRDPSRVQANGQCFLVRRAVLTAIGGFSRVLHSICEDVALARLMASAGYRVGFYEADRLVSTAMYGSWWEAWTNWPRSLPLRDQWSGWRTFIGLAEVTLVQALPLWLVPLLLRTHGRRHPLTTLNLALLGARIGVLAGMARAYASPPPAYWLSPVCDLPVALRLWWMASHRRHQWRGRTIDAGGPFR